jgi:hypothetical protein
MPRGDRPVESLLAWRQWRVSNGAGDGEPAGVTCIYPWTVLRFLTETDRKRVEDYSEQDIREFLVRVGATAYERGHYEHAVRSFFSWCEQRSFISSSPVTLPRRGVHPAPNWRQRVWRGIVDVIVTPLVASLASPEPVRAGSMVAVNLSPVEASASLRSGNEPGPGSWSPFHPLLRLVVVVVTAMGLEAALAAALLRLAR